MAVSCTARPASQVGDLYREHSRSLVRQLTRSTGCREVARELTNEAFLNLLLIAPDRFLRIEKPEAYLRRIATNLLINWARTRALHERAQGRLERAHEPQIEQLSILEARDTMRRLDCTIHKLKPKTRRIFLAQRLSGLTYRDIAEREGLSVKGVEKQMGKAIAKVGRLRDRG